ncbi:hypothetical protein SLEP1_g12720 [Rubroshorea leprosula]|uniref:RRM domain-containing protein n=1 Tax=Rubroshorea leprosula TaxID=152421 RepID=A0AAV5IDG3_9ROSI|nr:hypothetical protein SLEP1_g12720 [Rubroshorea leprosula]
MRARASVRERGPERATGSRERGQWTAQRYEGFQRESRKQPRENYGGFEKRIYNQAIPFFFTNFPDEWSFEQMWRTFNRLREGRVIEIECPKKRDRIGRRFGFVRFLEVKDAEQLERKLNQIQIGGFNLQANKPRFEKSGYQNQQQRNMGKRRPNVATSNAGTKRNLTYAEIVKGNNVDYQSMGLNEGQYHDANIREQSKRLRANDQTKWRWKPKQKPQAWSGMEFNVKQNEYGWLEKCFVGTVRSVTLIPTLQEKFFMEGVFFCKIRAMGGRLVLMEGHDYEDLKDLIETGQEWLGQWFEEIKPWKPTIVASERFAWIRCLGLPLHAWKPEFFQSFGSLWGTFVSLDDSTSGKIRLDAARFLIATPLSEFISKSLTIKINGVLYKVKFSEEESNNGLYIMNSDFKLKGGKEHEDKWLAEASEEDSDQYSGDIESEQVQGDEEDDDMASDLHVPETELEDEAREIDTRAHLIEDEASVTGGPDECFQKANEITTGGKEGSTRKHLMIAGLEEERSGMGAELDVSEENIGNREFFKKGAEKEASQVNISEFATDKTIAAVEERQRKEGEEIELIGPAKKLNSKDGRNGPKEDGPYYEELISLSLGNVNGPNNEEPNPTSLRKPSKMVKKAATHVRTEKEDSFWKYMADDAGEMPNWTKKGEEKKKKQQKRRVKTCRSVYMQSGGLKGFQLQKNKKGKRAVTENMAQEGVRRMWEEEVRELVIKHRVEVLFLKETKMEIVDRKLCRKLWDADNMEWVAKSAAGASGGLIIIWNSDIIKKMDVFEGEGFIGILGLWGPNQHPWGDFNAIKSSQESKGGKNARRDIKGFAEFIVMNGLQDLPLLGRKYTWYQPNGRCMSRLDRHGFSKMEGVRNSRLGRIHFKGEAEDAKDFLRVWSKSNIQEVDRKIEKSRKEINRVDGKGETSNLSNEDIIFKSSHYTELLKNMQIKEEMAQQKARKTWLKSGDANTSFFHKCIKGRWRRNEINVISVEGKELRQVEDIKQGVMKYFANLFSDEGWQRPTLEGLSFKSISEEDRSMLIEPFTEEEVKAAVWNCDSTKAPGPDGFTFGFIKNEWEVIKADIMVFLKDFHTNGRMVRGSNASFLVLIPKKENPQGIEEYRPISLIGCMYKILAKVLANRLSRVLNTIIGENQFAFIEGRQLVDSVVVANEAIDEVRKRKSQCFVFKIDFEKAYDKVIRELDKIRKNFLWGGVGEGRKIAWVAWERVCCGKKEGGLGVKNLRWFNMALLGKWWGRLIGGDKGLWSRVLLEKYGGKGGNWLSWMKEGKGIGSPWWNDICKLNIGLDKNCSIYDRGYWSDGRWCWRFQWRRSTRAWEEEKLQQLIGTINHIKPVQNVKDTWRWRPDNEGNYTTRSAYEQLAKKEESTLLEYKNIWSAQVPSKVAAFSWQMLLDRIPTKANLAKRGIMDDNQGDLVV